ncbi:thioredoxin family protein [Flagellimonas sp. S3867]|uniref:thioredoxin family protein n=1 Tax=Flagellimonas sp. S3867 TaxID=2768063 RepID=UPI001CC26D01|nr:thioredoxin family protein [Flagellimonas sp. S3867]
MMKPLLLIAFSLFFGTLQAQWQESFEDALELAEEANKPIVLVFSGSDWCAPCIRFKRNILDSEDFKDYSESHYVLYNADFPRKKKNKLPLEKLNSNKSLAAQFNPHGYFPLIVVLDKEKSLLGKTGFDKRASPKEFISLLNNFVR